MRIGKVAGTKMWRKRIRAVLAIGALITVGVTPLITADTNCDGGSPTAAPADAEVSAAVPANALNVRTFGAKGDGKTNDSQAIQKAVNTARSGDTIYFPAGTYWIDSSIAVNRSGLTFWGEGAHSVVEHRHRTGFQLGTDGQAHTGLLVKRLKFVGLPGKYKKSHGNTGIAIEVFGSKGTLIQDCDFQGSGTGVQNSEGKTFGTRIENCRVNGWGSVAIFCNGGEQILNCQLVQDDSDKNGEQSSHGIYIHSASTDVLVQDTLIQNARKYATQVYGQDVGTTTERSTFRRVTVKDCANGFTIQQSEVKAARAKGVLIEDCSITGTYAGPAVSVKQGDGIQIVKNLIDGGSAGLQLGVWAPYEPGFWISHLQATGNVIRNCERGIWGLASNGGRFINVTLTGNQISNCKVPVDLGGAPSIVFSP